MLRAGGLHKLEPCSTQITMWARQSSTMQMTNSTQKAAPAQIAMWVAEISLLLGTEAHPEEGAAPGSAPGGLHPNHLEKAVVPSKRLCPGGCESSVDIDIDLQAQVSLGPCSNQSLPAHAFLKREQVQISWQSK